MVSKWELETGNGILEYDDKTVKLDIYFKRSSMDFAYIRMSTDGEKGALTIGTRNIGDPSLSYDRMWINENGNVGIGWAKPAAKLSINGGLHVGGDTDPLDDNLWVDGYAGIKGGLHVGSDLNLNPGNGNLLVEGSVGIGKVPSSDATLDIKGGIKLLNGGMINEFSVDGTLADNSDSAVPTEKAVKTYVDDLNSKITEISGIIWKDDGNTTKISSPSNRGYIKFQSNCNKTAMVIDTSNGKVGIGTEKPTEKLEVAGNIKIGSGTFLGGLIRTNDIRTSSEHYFFGPDNSLALIFGIYTDTKDNKIIKQINTGEDWNLSGRTKSFLIDHPLSPERKHLIHSTLEGPEVAVFYRGESQLSNGETTVLLPDYFEALTRKENRTVLLTPIFQNGAPVSMLATSTVEDGKFTVIEIDGKNPSQKFYWEVKAVRADVGILEVERIKR